MVRWCGKTSGLVKAVNAFICWFFPLGGSCPGCVTVLFVVSSSTTRPGGGIPGWLVERVNILVKR